METLKVLFFVGTCHIRLRFHSSRVQVSTEKILWLFSDPCGGVSSQNAYGLWTVETIFKYSEVLWHCHSIFFWYISEKFGMGLIEQMREMLH